MTDKEIVEEIRTALEEEGAVDTLERCLETLRKIVRIVFP
jgi:hypothetical protein